MREFRHLVRHRHICLRPPCLPVAAATPRTHRTVPARALHAGAPNFPQPHLATLPASLAARGASRLPVAHSRALCAPRCTCRDHGELLEHGAGEPVHVGPARQRALWPGTPAAAGQCFLRLYSARLRLHLLLRPHACLEFYMRGLALSPLASARDVKLVRAVSAAMLGPTRTLVPFADSFWTHTSSSPHLLPPPIVYSRPSQEATRPTASTRAPA